jgi:pyridoxamine 5'-phosphate oxidase-like protein
MVYTGMEATNLDGYGTPPIQWQLVRDVLTADIAQIPGSGGPDRHTPWLTTINPDGAPHVTPVGIVTIDGVWYFSSGPATRKSRNIAGDPRCVVSIATHPFDLVVEGSAARVTDADELAAVAAEFAEQGWPAQVEGDALTAEYSAPSAGPPPWHVYRITQATVFAFGTAEPYGATKFDLTR